VNCGSFFACFYKRCKKQLVPKNIMLFWLSLNNKKFILKKDEVIINKKFGDGKANAKHKECRWMKELF